MANRLDEYGMDPAGNTRHPGYNNFAGYKGMQIHAVPDSDKAFDASTGRKLPWGYDIDRTLASGQREPAEKGPFGRGTNRRARSTLSRSRSKTAEPRREEDRIRAEQVAAEDAVFGSLRRVKDAGALSEDADAQKAAAASAVAAKGQEEATEVMLYGFGEDVQWAAIQFYEKISGGVVLEDYDREPPGVPPVNLYSYAHLFASAGATKSWSRAALKKKNAYAGGEHWIKVTFSNKNAAELACARSPHVLRGYLVYAEPYIGRGPGKDEAIPATQAGAQITEDALPMTFSTTENMPIDTSPGGSSTTATSATATGRTGRTTDSQTSSNTLDAIFAPQRPQPQQQGPLSPAPPTSPQQPGPGTLRRRRISGARLATVHPASMALAPKAAKQSWSSWLLGTGDVIGSTVPKREDGMFDWEKAGFYWRVFCWLDGVFGTDFCGLRGD